MIVACDTCGKQFARNPAKVARGATQYCSRPCADVGHVGRRHPADALARMRANPERVLATTPLVCEACGCTFERRTGEARRSRRHFCSRACAFASRRGENQANWKGDEATRRAAHIRAVRAVPTRPCDGCGADRRALQRHHVDRNPWNNAPENLRVLCVPCHARAHAELRAANG